MAPPSLDGCCGCVPGLSANSQQTLPPLQLQLLCHGCPLLCIPILSMCTEQTSCPTINCHNSDNSQEGMYLTLANSARLRNQEITGSQIHLVCLGTQRKPSFPTFLILLFPRDLSVGEAQVSLNTWQEGAHITITNTVRIQLCLLRS